MGQPIVDIEVGYAHDRKLLLQGCGMSSSAFIYSYWQDNCPILEKQKDYWEFLVSASEKFLKK